MSAPERERGQASVELVAALPVLVVATLIALQLAVAGFALWSAASAARAGARAAYVGDDGHAAALDALPHPLRDGARITGSAAVRVQVPVPAVSPGFGSAQVRAGADLSGGPGPSGG
jgi:hypothetical protein